MRLPPGSITTIAGTGLSSHNGEGLPALQTNLSRPATLGFDGIGNLYVTEPSWGRIRRISTGSGIVTTVAGNGTTGFSGDGGPGTAAQTSGVFGLAVDPAGNVYVPDSSNSRLRRVDASTGIINTVLGNGSRHYCGDNRPAVGGCLWGPNGIALDALNNVYIADSVNERIRKVTAASQILSTIAGRDENAAHGGDGGPAIDATFGDMPRGITRDAAGNLYIAGGFSHRVRRISATTGLITTIAGTGTAGFAGDGGAATLAQLREPSDVAIDAAGNVFISDTGNHRIRRIDAATGVITTIAGTGDPNGVLDSNGMATGASLNQPGAIAMDHLSAIYSSSIARTTGCARCGWHRAGSE